MYLLLDTETTGVDTEKDDVIQIAYQVVDELGSPLTDIAVQFCSTVTSVPYAASAVNHIIAEDLIKAPSIDDVIRDINTVCKEYNVKAMVCHNLPFDGPMLAKYHIPPKFSVLEGLCTLKLARSLFPDADSHALQFLRYYLKLDVPRDVGAHRADVDVIVLASLFREILEKVPTLDGLLGICDRPVYIKRMPFGKHKGTLLTDIPGSYIEWALRLDDIDLDLRYSLRKSLRKN